MKRLHKIALLPGDGIGPEVLEEGKLLLETIQQLDQDLTFAFETFPWGSEHFRTYGKMMPEDGLQQLKQFDAIYFGAVGSPEVPEEVAVRELVIAIRKGFDLYVNLRPIQLLAEEFCPIKGKTVDDIAITFVRENTEGEYANIGHISHADSPEGFAMQTGLFTRKGTERIMRFAFDYAKQKGGHVTSISKSNALAYSMVFWDRLFEEVGSRYPDVSRRTLLVDAAALLMVLRPESFDVVVASNLFGDILTDLGAALQGGLGFAASANIDPTRRHPAMFEPVHGSAPDIAGSGKANPIAAIWTASMLLDWIGEDKWSERVRQAISHALSDKEARTPDLGGTWTTRQVGDAIRRSLGVLAAAE